MKRLLLPCLFVIVSTAACKGEPPVGGVTGNANAGNGTATGAGNGGQAGASSTGSTTGDPAGGTGGNEAATPVNGGATTAGGSDSEGGRATTMGGAATTGNAGAIANGGERPDAPIVRVDELDGGADSLSDEELYDVYTATFEYGEALWCVCIDGGTSAQCAGAIGSTPFAEQQCLSEQTFLDANGRSNVECRLQAEEDLVLCFAPDDAAEDVCTASCADDYAAAIEGCAELSDQTWVAIGQECYDIEPFECDGGDTVIPSFRLCDLTSDCADQADELQVNCPN